MFALFVTLAVLLDLESMLYAFVPVGLYPIITLLHILLKGGLFFLSHLHFVSVRTCRRRVVWISPGESGSYRESFKYL